LIQILLKVFFLCYETCPVFKVIFSWRWLEKQE
jgi:hypothetical protein